MASIQVQLAVSDGSEQDARIADLWDLSATPAARTSSVDVAAGAFAFADLPSQRGQFGETWETS